MTDRLFSDLTGESIKVWGRNPTVGTAWEDLTAYAQPTAWYTILAAGFALDVTSSSANDTNSAGTGARKIRIIGLDANKVAITEVVNMNGQTIVTTSNTWTDVWAADVVESGSTGNNVGDIHIVKTGTGGTYTTGVPGTLTSAICKILATWNTEMLGHYKVPAGIPHRYQVADLCIGTYTQSAQFGVFLQQPESATDAGLHLACLFSAGSSGTQSTIDMIKSGLILSPGDAVHVRALGASASAVASATFRLVKV